MKRFRIQDKKTNCVLASVENGIAFICGGEDISASYKKSLMNHKDVTQFPDPKTFDPTAKNYDSFELPKNIPIEYQNKTHYTHLDEMYHFQHIFRAHGRQICMNLSIIE